MKQTQCRFEPCHCPEANTYCEGSRAWPNQGTLSIPWTSVGSPWIHLVFSGSRLTCLHRLAAVLHSFCWVSTDVLFVPVGLRIAIVGNKRCSCLGWAAFAGNSFLVRWNGIMIEPNWMHYNLYSLHTPPLNKQLINQSKWLKWNVLI